MPDIRKIVGQRVRALREGKGWKQDELAHRSGLHVTYIGGIERGERNATIGSLAKVADAFGISVVELFAPATHELEKQFNAPAGDIMEAILHGFRARVDVKGKIAELYLFQFLKRLEAKGTIQDVIWHDADGKPDFEITYKGKRHIIECKNLRSGKDGRYSREESYKVEVQKTRNSKDGSKTRYYKIDHFDILATCLFNQTGKWEFVHAAAKHLKKKKDDEPFLEIMQPVPCKTCFPWAEDFMTILKDVAGEKPFEPKSPTVKQQTPL